MRRTVIIILSIAILCSLFVVVFAVTTSNTEDMATLSADAKALPKARFWTQFIVLSVQEVLTVLNVA